MSLYCYQVVKGRPINTFHAYKQIKSHKVHLLVFGKITNANFVSELVLSIKTIKHIIFHHGVWLSADVDGVNMMD